MHHLLDSTFNGMGGSEMYRATLLPELFPHAPKMTMNAWPDDERAPLVGGEEAKAYYRNENARIDRKKAA